MAYYGAGSASLEPELEAETELNPASSELSARWQPEPESTMDLEPGAARVPESATAHETQLPWTPASSDLIDHRDALSLLLSRKPAVLRIAIGVCVRVHELFGSSKTVI